MRCVSIYFFVFKQRGLRFPLHNPYLNWGEYEKLKILNCDIAKKYPPADMTHYVDYQEMILNFHDGVLYYQRSRFR